MKLIPQVMFSIFSLLISINGKDVQWSCYSNLNCKYREYSRSLATSDEHYNCIDTTYIDFNSDEKFYDDSDYSCHCRLYGLNNKQCELYKRLLPSQDECFPLYELDIYECVDMCTAIYGDCYKKCNEFYQLLEGTCLAKLANKPKFDVRKSIECANSCNQVTFSEVFDCDYFCKKEVYDALIEDFGIDENFGESLVLEDLNNSISTLINNSGDENIENNISNSFISTDTNNPEDESNNGKEYFDSSINQSNDDISNKKVRRPSSSLQYEPTGRFSEFPSIGKFQIFTLILATLILLILYNNLV